MDVMGSCAVASLQRCATALAALLQGSLTNLEWCRYFEDYLPGPKRTVFHTMKGLSWRNPWGVLRYSANNAFLALVHSQQVFEQARPRLDAAILASRSWTLYPSCMRASCSLKAFQEISTDACGMYTARLCWTHLSSIADANSCELACFCC